MSTIDRCDEIIRLIDEVLQELSPETASQPGPARPSTTLQGAAGMLSPRPLLAIER